MNEEVNSWINESTAGTFDVTPRRGNDLASNAIYLSTKEVKLFRVTHHEAIISLYIEDFFFILSVAIYKANCLFLHFKACISGLVTGRREEASIPLCWATPLRFYFTVVPLSYEWSHAWEMNMCDTRRYNMCSSRNRLGGEKEGMDQSASLRWKMTLVSG